MKTKKISRRKFLEKELDTIVSKIVILRDGGCVTPGGCSGWLTCSHYYKRGHHKTRWNLINCNCQCSTHNGRHNQYHVYYELYMLKTYSREQLTQLAEEASLKSYKWAIEDMEKLLEQYQHLYESMNIQRDKRLPQDTSPVPYTP